MHLHCRVSVTLSMLNSKNPVKSLECQEVTPVFVQIQFSHVPFCLIQGRPKAMRDLTQFTNATSLSG